MWSCMKITNLFNKLQPALLISALTLPVVLIASSPDGLTVTAAATTDDAEKVVTGRVDAKSDTSLHVNGQVVLLDDSTTYVRNGAPAKLDDIKTGDEVRVTVAVGAAGSRVAAKVEATSSGR